MIIIIIIIIITFIITFIITCIIVIVIVIVIIIIMISSDNSRGGFAGAPPMCPPQPAWGSAAGQPYYGHQSPTD